MALINTVLQTRPGRQDACWRCSLPVCSSPQRLSRPSDCRHACPCPAAYLAQQPAGSTAARAEYQASHASWAQWALLVMAATLAGATLLQGMLNVLWRAASRTKPLPDLLLSPVPQQVLCSFMAMPASAAAALLLTQAGPGWVNPTIGALAALAVLAYLGLVAAVALPVARHQKQLGLRYYAKGGSGKAGGQEAGGEEDLKRGLQRGPLSSDVEAGVWGQEEVQAVRVGQWSAADEVQQAELRVQYQGGWGCCCWCCWPLLVWMVVFQRLVQLGLQSCACMLRKQSICAPPAGVPAAVPARCRGHAPGRSAAQQHKAVGCHQRCEHQLQSCCTAGAAAPVATCLLTRLLLCLYADGIPYGVFGVLQQVWRGTAGAADRRDGKEVSSSGDAVAKPEPAACPLASAAARRTCPGALCHRGA